jgi:hypothetical protein
MYVYIDYTQYFYPIQFALFVYLILGVVLKTAVLKHPAPGWVMVML